MRDPIHHCGAKQICLPDELRGVASRGPSIDFAGRGDLLDEAWSYTALRSVNVESDRVALNGRP